MRFVLFLLILLGCGSPVHGECESDNDCQSYQECVLSLCETDWICHRPGHELHNKPCTEECFVPGDRGIFCWPIPDAGIRANPYNI